MGYKIAYGPDSSLYANCIWLNENTRNICITYYYDCFTGELMYAASVYRKSYHEEIISHKMIKNHEHTTKQRFSIRPVKIVVKPYMSSHEVIKTIRYEMCHGYGCKGPRNNINADSESDISIASDVSNVSNVSNVSSTIKTNKYQVDPSTFNIKTIRKIRYYLTTNERCGFSNKTHRDIYICFKGSMKTGDVLFGSCIHRKIPNTDVSDTLIEGHWKTAKARLDKCPVHMNISPEFRHQLNRTSKHCEDVMYEIIDKIFSRQHGQLQIRG